MPKKAEKKEVMKIQQASLLLEEMRVITPGTQALLGFQFTAFFSSGFEKIPQLLKDLHLTSLIFVTLCTLFLMSPVSYHRIAENGNVTSRFQKFSGRVVLFAMSLLAIGIALDIFVVTSYTTKSYFFATCLAAMLLLLFYLAWFGYTFFLQKTRSLDT